MKNKKRVTVYLDSELDIALSVKLASLYQENKVKLNKSEVFESLLKSFLETDNSLITVQKED